MAYQQWNWQHKNWPNFSYNKNVIKDLELLFSMFEKLVTTFI